MEGHLCTQFNSKYVYLFFTWATFLNDSFIYAAWEYKIYYHFLSAPFNVQFNEKIVLVTFIFTINNTKVKICLKINFNS